VRTMWPSASSICVRRVRLGCWSSMARMWPRTGPLWFISSAVPALSTFWLPAPQPAISWLSKARGVPGSGGWPS